MKKSKYKKLKQEYKILAESYLAVTKELREKDKHLKNLQILLSWFLEK